MHARPQQDAVAVGAQGVETGALALFELLRFTRRL